MPNGQEPRRDGLDTKPGSKVDSKVGPDQMLSLRVTTRGSAGLHGLLAAPNESPRSVDEIDTGVTMAVSQRARPAR